MSFVHSSFHRKSLWGDAMPAAGSPEADRPPRLPDPAEQEAAEEFYSALRSRRRSTQSALDRLARFWEE